MTGWRYCGSVFPDSYPVGAGVTYGAGYDRGVEARRVGCRVELFVYCWVVPLWSGGYSSRLFQAESCVAPVTLCRRCGVTVPMKTETPPGIVAEWLSDNGHDDTPLHRFLMWCHWEFWEAKA